MTSIIGYGEDALTFWVLRNRLEAVLRKLEDKSKIPDCMVFYRPSFGRGGKNSASFGEFDAIVSTKTHIYLIESKWEGESKNPEKKIKLSEAQCNRHKVFAEYFARWNSSSGKLSLAACGAQEYLQNNCTKKVVSSKAKLANHLQFVLSRTATRRDNGTKKELKNVLLFLHREEDDDTRVAIDIEDFTLISVKCPVSIDLENNSWFFEMDESSAI